jgi:hypothetical protein
MKRKVISIKKDMDWQDFDELKVLDILEYVADNFFDGNMCQKKFKIIIEESK